MIWVAGRSPTLVFHSLRGVAMNLKATTLTYLAIIVYHYKVETLEIENPFGKDPNDLPLAQFCHQIAQDVERLLSLESGHNLTDVTDEVVTQIVRPIKHYREVHPSRRSGHPHPNHKPMVNFRTS